MTWKTIHPSSLDADTPYDTMQLTDLRDRSAEMSSNYGQAATFWIGGKYGNVADYASTRPFVSVTGFACLASIPWWVPKNLKTLKCDLWLRVSNAEIDEDTEVPGEALLPVEVNVRFLRNGAVGSALVSPLISGPDAVWQRIAFDYDLGEWGGDSQGGFWDYLVLEFRSTIESGLGTSDVFGTTDKSTIGNRKPYRVLADTAGFFANLAAPAPQPYAHETMCTIASEYGIATPYRVLGVWDNVLSADGGDSMVIWPPSDTLVTDAGYVWKTAAAYIQVASLGIQEVFDDDLTNVQDNEILSLQPSYFSVPHALAADVNDVLTRPEIASGVSQGWSAEAYTAGSGALWRDRSYLKRFRSTYGELGAPRNLVRQGSQTRLPVGSFVFRAQLAGVFATGNYYERETYTETADKSIVGHVTVRATVQQWVGGAEVVVGDSGEIIKKMRFVIANKLSKSRWLYNTAWLNKDAGIEPEAFCYGEGLLRLDGPRSAIGAEYTKPPGSESSLTSGASDDSVVLTDPDGLVVLEFTPTVDFDYRRPYTVVLAVEVTNGPSGETPEFLHQDTAKSAALRMESDRTPLREAMQVFCVSQGMFTLSDPPIAAGDFNFRGRIRSRDLRTVLDAQNLARQAWGRRIVVDFDDDYIELDDPSESQVNFSGGQGLDRIDFDFRPVRPEIRGAAAAASDKTNSIVEMVARVTGDVTVIAKFYTVNQGEVTSNTPTFTMSASGSDEWVQVSKVIELDSSPPGEIQTYRVRIFAIGEGGHSLDYLAIGEPDTIGPADIGPHLIGADEYIAPFEDLAGFAVWRGYETLNILSGSAEMARDEFGPRINAASFDGATSNMSANFAIGTSMIYAAAFNSDVSDAVQRNILHHRVGGLVKTVCRLYVLSGNLYVETEQGGVLSAVLVRSAAAATWYDVVVAITNGLRRVWVDGVLYTDEVKGVLPTGSGTMYVGRGASGGYFDGKIALVDAVSGWDARNVERYMMRRRQTLGI